MIRRLDIAFYIAAIAFAIATAAGADTAPTTAIQADLVRSVGEPVEYYVVGEWRSERAYADWQAVSGPEADQEALAEMRACLAGHAPGRLFETVIRSG